MNVILEASAKVDWELETAMQRMRITRNVRGTKLRRKWTKKIGKLVREGKVGGID